MFDPTFSVLNWLLYHFGLITGRINWLGDPTLAMVSVIIVTQDQTAAVQRCVETLLEKTAYTEYELLLVDNGSANGLVVDENRPEHGADRQPCVTRNEVGEGGLLRAAAQRHA